MNYRFITPLIFMLISSSAYAAESGDSSMWSRIKSSVSQNLSDTWDSQDYELYVPINTWHNREYYTREKIDDYNEMPWGLGIGKYRYDQDGDWHAIYGMVFEDSNYAAEPVVGYAFQKEWQPVLDVRLGLGYTVGATMRQDMHYIPIPIIAPLFSASYKRFALQSTYIPGGDGNGNILFTWVRWQL